jgi:hypothetical protein
MESDTDDVDVDVDADIQMRQIMGFGSFGMQKPGMSSESYSDLTLSNLVFAPPQSCSVYCLPRILCV